MDLQHYDSLTGPREGNVSVCLCVHRILRCGTVDAVVGEFPSVLGRVDTRPGGTGDWILGSGWC